MGKNMPEEDYEKCRELFYKYQGGDNWAYKYEAYLTQESLWDSFLDGQIDLQNLSDLDDMFIDRNFMDKILNRCPEKVKNAWQHSLMNVGNIFHSVEYGRLTYFSELYRRVLESMLRGNGFDILGITEDEAEDFATEEIKNLSNSSGFSENAARMREKELAFYNDFLINLKGEI